MPDLYDALEDCLVAMERGASIETALKRYPRIANELRPLLSAALMAKNSSRVHVPLEVRRRGRSKMQQQLAAMDESRATRRRVIPAFPRIALTGIIAIALMLTSTGLVSASSSSLPGEQLYPVKRTWESVRLLFVFNQQQRDLLESGYEQERVDEISELLGQHKAAPISFSGILAQQSNGQWMVSGIPVAVSGTTNLPSSPVANGVPLSVSGMTREDGVVEAHQIQVLQPGSSLPPLEPSESQDGEGHDQGEESDVTSTPAPSPTPTAAGNGASQPVHASYQYSGVIQSMQGNVWTINGQVVHTDAAQVSGDVTIGSIVRFSGYYGSDGSFMVTSVQLQTGGTDTKHNGGSDQNSGEGTNQPSGGGEGSEGGGSGGERP